MPSPRTVGGQAAVFVNVLRQSSEETLSPRHVGGVERRFTPELLDEIREFIDGGTWANFSENRVKSFHIVSHKFSRKAIRLSALASVGDPQCAPPGGPSHP